MVWISEQAGSVRDSQPSAIGGPDICAWIAIDIHREATLVDDAIEALKLAPMSAS